MRKVIFLITILLLVFLSVFAADAPAQAQENAVPQPDVKEMILEHLADTYEWTVLDWHKGRLAIPLPVILYDKTQGWQIFMSSKLSDVQHPYRGYYLAGEGKYKGKIVGARSDGTSFRPLDLSLTRNAVSIMFASTLLIVIVMGVARALKKNPMEAKGGFTGVMEMFIVSVLDDIIKPAVGRDYARYAPFLLTLFFFIFLNNILGIIPFFPGGANVTGNIAVTLVLAVSTLLVVNFTGTKEYYKEIFWPDVPTWLKVPVPLMPFIEIIGIFTKPFALMIRLFANITGGHSTVMGLTAVIFVTASMGTAINSSMTVLSVIFTVFINFVELLVAYIQAYVFTMLSAVFIGMARERTHQKEKELIETRHLYEEDNKR